MTRYDEALVDLAEVIRRGGAVCFLGAGFSLGATDARARSVPNSAELTGDLGSLAGLSDTAGMSLSDVAEYLESDALLTRKMRNLLVDRLTLCQPTEDQKVILSPRWRSVFTTNFDDVAEQSFAAGRCQAITPTLSPEVHDRTKTPLYYLHGRARDLIESDVDPSFVVSDRNYLSLREENKSLYARLKNELFAANAIVLIGYSLRDLEIARILIEDGYAFRRKTYVIVSESENVVSRARLEKFGTLLPVGMHLLSKALSESENRPLEPDTAPFEFVDCIEPTSPSSKIEGDDFVNYILTGNFDREKYVSQIQGADDAEIFSVRRAESIELILNRSTAGLNRFVVSADLGNGKTAFMDQLAEELLFSGLRVIRVSSNLEEVFDDVERAIGDGRETAFLIDDVIRYRRVAKFIGARLNSSCLLICAVRGDPTEVALTEFINSIGGASRLIDINRLNSSELMAWDRALERWGLWEQRIELPQNERIRFLSEQCAAENRSIVLSLFRNSKIARKIDQLVTFFVNSGRHERAFAAILISSLCQKHVDWQSIVSWLNIDESSLRSDIAQSEVAALFVNGRDWNVLTSAQLAEYILRNKYVELDYDVIVDVYSTIVLQTAESAGDGYLGGEARENLKELMKFRFLTRLFGDGDSAYQVIAVVYSRLSKARLIRGNPQFWLQYAMSRMEAGDLDAAEVYLNTALGLAKERGADYSPFQIIDQRARLLLKKNSSEHRKHKKSEVVTAVKDLSELLDDSDAEIIYIYRSVPLIHEFLEIHIDSVDEELKASIGILLQRLRDRSSAYTRLPRSQKGETRVLEDAMKKAQLVLSFG